MKLVWVLLVIVALAYCHGAGDDHVDEPDCEHEGLDEEEYDLPFHVGAIFIQIGVSSISVFFPAVLGRLKVSMKSPKIALTVEILKFFGTGIIISTAFIHLLPSAFEQFGNPCLTGGWGEYSVGFVGVFAMIAVFAMQLIEFLSLCKMDQIKARKMVAKDRATSSDHLVTVEKATSSDDGDSHQHDLSHGGDGHVHGLILEGDGGISLYILEFGIALHSVLIGLTLSNTTGGEFVSLLIALAFHQCFEGLGLGTRIMSHKLPLLKMLSMCAIYGLATPLGIAIGIGIRYSYNPNSQNAILATGILESLASGILLYNSFVGLLAAEMNQDRSFRAASNRDKAIKFVSMYVGATAMAVVGYWA